MQSSGEPARGGENREGGKDRQTMLHEVKHYEKQKTASAEPVLGHSHDAGSAGRLQQQWRRRQEEQRWRQQGQHRYRYHERNSFPFSL